MATEVPLPAEIIEMDRPHAIVSGGIAHVIWYVRPDTIGHPVGSVWTGDFDGRKWIDVKKVFEADLSWGVHTPWDFGGTRRNILVVGSWNSAHLFTFEGGQWHHEAVRLSRPVGYPVLLSSPPAGELVFVSARSGTDLNVVYSTRLTGDTTRGPIELVSPSGRVGAHDVRYSGDAPSGRLFWMETRRPGPDQVDTLRRAVYDSATRVWILRGHPIEDESRALSVSPLRDGTDAVLTVNGTTARLRYWKQQPSLPSVVTDSAQGNALMKTIGDQVWMVWGEVGDPSAPHPITILIRFEQICSRQ